MRNGRVLNGGESPNLEERGTATLFFFTRNVNLESIHRLAVVLTLWSNRMQKASWRLTAKSPIIGLKLKVQLMMHCKHFCETESIWTVG